ncbi:transcription antitermination factor NusB [Gordonia zhaorongruii]|uniref:transcription antitermination factor NusB n=1 Tax=Gordonia zhaorongruii TaxID=2597659 RepID=UPI001051A2E8|nr:transcription antitermination factor NusB [Gordonia zhaorongruii]
MRRRAVDILFEADVKQVPATQLVNERRGWFAEHDAVGQMSGYVVTLVEGVAGDESQIDAVLTSHLENWRLERLPAVDRAILRLATWELFNSADVDVPVVVDEAVTLASELSTEGSPAFVNGVLDRIAALAPQVRAAAVAQAVPRAGRDPEGPGAR